jgi:hypothetical protein
MDILDAVYTSSGRYNNPDNRYGYGIPNMQTAWLMLKKRQNDSLYGTDWLFASPSPFTSSVHITLIGQVDGPVTLALKDAGGNTLATINMVTEQEEVYDTVFNSLGNYIAGDYTLVYTDSSTTRSVPLVKLGDNVNGWLQPIPVPFNQQLTVYIKAPETGLAFLRLINAAGQTVATLQLAVQEGDTYFETFSNAAFLAKGVYFVQYAGPTQNKTVKVVKD